MRGCFLLAPRFLLFPADTCPLRPDASLLTAVMASRRQAAKPSPARAWAAREVAWVPVRWHQERAHAVRPYRTRRALAMTRERMGERMGDKAVRR